MAELPADAVFCPDIAEFTAPKEDTDDMVSDEKAQEIAFGQDTL